MSIEHPRLSSSSIRLFLFFYLSASTLIVTIKRQTPLLYLSELEATRTATRIWFFLFPWLWIDERFLYSSKHKRHFAPHIFHSRSDYFFRFDAATLHFLQVSNVVRHRIQKEPLVSVATKHGDYYHLEMPVGIYKFIKIMTMTTFQESYTTVNFHITDYPSMVMSMLEYFIDMGWVKRPTVADAILSRSCTR